MAIETAPDIPEESSQSVATHTDRVAIFVGGFFLVAGSLFIFANQFESPDPDPLKPKVFRKCAVDLSGTWRSNRGDVMEITDIGSHVTIDLLRGASTVSGQALLERVGTDNSTVLEGTINAQFKTGGRSSGYIRAIVRGNKSDLNIRCEITPYSNSPKETLTLTRY